MVRLKGKGKRDEAEDTPNTKQSKSIPSSSNPIQSPSESNEEGLSGLDYDVTKELIKLSDEATKKITYIHQIAYAIPSSEPDEPQSLYKCKFKEQEHTIFADISL